MLYMFQDFFVGMHVEQLCAFLIVTSTFSQTFIYLFFYTKLYYQWLLFHSFIHETHKFQWYFENRASKIYIRRLVPTKFTKRFLYRILNSNRYKYLLCGVPISNLAEAATSDETSKVSRVLCDIHCHALPTDFCSPEREQWPCVWYQWHRRAYDEWW